MRVAVVGGGASAVAFLDALARAIPRGLRQVSVFEPRGVVGPGRPYRADPDAALINRPAREMSIRHDRPLDFQDWLHRRMALGATRPEERGAVASVSADARFQPRWLFGQYLRSRFTEATERLADSGAQLEVYADPVYDIAEQDGGLATRCPSGMASAYDAVVLCLGTPRPADVYGLAGRPGFIRDPYPLPVAIPADEPVTVLGSNLSAVDIALALIRRGHVGPIRLMSRHGLLPSVRSLPAQLADNATEQLEHVVHHAPAAELWPTVRDLLVERLAVGGSRAAEIAADMSSAERPQERLHRQLGRSNNSDCWRSELLALLDPVGELLWQRLPVRTRKSFLVRHNTRFATVLNPMPPATAATLLEAITDGRLTVVPGVRTVTARPDGFEIVAAGQEYRAELLLNAVRATPYEPTEPAGHLLDRLAARGLARPHPCGGVSIDFHTNRVLGPAKGLFALGHPTAGDIYYANAGSMLGIGKRAERIVDELTASVADQPAARSPEVAMGGRLDG